MRQRFDQLEPRTKLIIALAIFGMVAAILAIASFIVFKEIGKSGGFSGGSFFTAQETTPRPGETPGIPTQGGPGGLPAPEPWNGNDRVTILLLGLDYRDWIAESSSARSDTMILITVDPVTKTGGILSVPRDLWANIPGFEPGKINTAYYLGDIYKLPGGGPALAMKTVEQTIGVPIDYYAQIDFATFERFVDLIGGVKVDVKETIKLEPIGDHPDKTLKPGVQALPGWLALAYARNRSAPGGDFGRAERQQQVIMGIFDRVTDPTNFARMMDNVDEIYAELKSGIKTNLPLEDAIKLAVLAAQVKEEDIKRGVINEKYVNFGRSPDDLAILIPIPDRIRALRDEIFGSGGAFSPVTVGTPTERMQQEAARISVLNGTGGGDIGNLTANYLQSQGANIANIGPAGQAYFTTIVIDHTGNPFTLQFLFVWMGLTPNQVYHAYDPNHPYDVEIILGSDWLNSNPLP